MLSSKRYSFGMIKMRHKYKRIVRLYNNKRSEKFNEKKNQKGKTVSQGKKMNAS